MPAFPKTQKEVQNGYYSQACRGTADPPGTGEGGGELIDGGNTIPFIARYRKEATGALNDEILRNLDVRLRYLRNLEEKKEQVLASVEEQGKLTEEFKKAVLAAETLVAVEDLYRPFRPKRRTRAAIAKEAWPGTAGECDPAAAAEPTAWKQKRRSMSIRKKRFRTRHLRLPGRWTL